MPFPGSSRCIVLLVCCALVAVTLPGVLHGGPPPAPNVRGKIFDQSHMAIPGATITAAAEGRRMNASTHSGETGEFSLYLSPGSYVLRIAADGFQSATHALVVADAV